MDRGPFIATRFGRWHLLDPRPADVQLPDIAWSLAHTNRYTGHAGTYSVATHSRHVARIVVEVLERPDLELDALLHDAHEAYVGDVSAPLKRALPDYRAIEERTERVVRGAFGLGPEMDPVTRRADLMALADEASQFFDDWQSWGLPVAGSGLRVEVEAAGDAMARWLGAVERGLRA